MNRRTSIVRLRALSTRRAERCSRRLSAALLACWLLTVPLLGQNSRPNEYEVKAAYLFNFGKFLGTPLPTTAPLHARFEICVLGHDPFGPVLDATLAGEQINGQEVVARRIQKPQEALTCQILFISTSEESRLKAILIVLHDAPVLTVSDIQDFASEGGMIHFILEQDRVRFEVNLLAAERAHLALSSQLLKVASNVRREAKLGH